MNEERASYALGYRAVGTISQIDPAYDLGMALFHKEPKTFYTVPQLDEIRFRENRKAWFDGYLDRSLEVGGRQAEAAKEVYCRHYLLNIRPETVSGKQYTLFFEQLDTYRWHNNRYDRYEIYSKVPPPVLRIDVNAVSFPKAIRQAWSTIANGDTSLLASVSLLGVYLPVHTDDPRKDLLHRYYNAAIDVDAGKQRLKAPKRQFLREESKSHKASEIIEQERRNLAGHKAVEKALAEVYKSMTGNAPPPLSEVFLIAYAEDIVGDNSLSPEDGYALQAMLGDYEYSKNTERLAAYVYEGVMPNGEINAENSPILEWDLHDQYFLTDQHGWSPLQKLYDEVRDAVQSAKAGDTEALSGLLNTCREMRAPAQYANELMEVGCAKAVDTILTAMKSNLVPYRGSYLTEQNRAALDDWRSLQQ